jgi:hypothetical protein
MHGLYFASSSKCCGAIDRTGNEPDGQCPLGHVAQGGPHPRHSGVAHGEYPLSDGGRNIHQLTFAPATASPVTVTASQYTSQNSTGTETTSDAGGGQDVGWINSSSWLEYTGVNFGSGLTGTVAARIASNLTGAGIGTIQFRLDSLTATPFATVTVNGTGGWQDWITAATTASPVPVGTHTLYVTFATNTGGNFANVNWFQFS